MIIGVVEKNDTKLTHAEPDCLFGCATDCYSGDRGFDPPVLQHSFVSIGHEIISTAILSLSLIQVVQLSVTGESMCTKLSTG